MKQTRDYSYSNVNFMHISIDDVYGILKELNKEFYESIYQNEIFKFLKKMHDQYGAVFSLYCFSENTEDSTWTLYNMTNKFKLEFSNASSWLKFGFHAQKYNLNYDETITADDALKHYDFFVTAVKNFACNNSIDIIPRIHYFSGGIEHARAWKNTNNGVKGFLSADDKREINGYLNAEERDILEAKPYYYEAREKLYFFKTNLRLEKISDAYKSLEDINTNYFNAEKQNIQVIFTHEKFLYNEQIKNKIEDCCKWAIDNNYIFTYPMEYIQQNDNCQK
jgi:hypothetical protein